MRLYTESAQQYITDNKEPAPMFPVEAFRWGRNQVFGVVEEVIPLQDNVYQASCSAGCNDMKRKAQPKQG